MKNSFIMLVVLFVLLQFSCNTIWARPITAYEALQAVAGWLRLDPRPLDTNLGGQVAKVETFNNENGEAIYYVVYLDPAGFVIIPADDLVEPIVGFADDGKYDPSPDNPLGALVTNDLNGRVATVRNVKRLEASGRMEEALKSRAKWGRLISSAYSTEDDIVAQGLGSITDVRVPPLVQSKWGQEEMCLRDWYNYYTSYGYPCGCVATAMAQVMWYYRHPTSGIGVQGFMITVDDEEYIKYTRGGDGYGGPYEWDDMIPNPDCGDLLNTGAAEATGALCYDAGISVNMNYASDGSGADERKPKYALKDTFQYHNAIIGYNSSADIGLGLIGMVNPNLDAKSPVLLCVRSTDSAHEVVCDGYGYESSTLYHHLNMGWEGSDDAWYNLPNIDSDPGPYNCVSSCIYNIRPTGIGNGEVISGRVCCYLPLLPEPMPIPNVIVCVTTDTLPPPPPPSSMRELDSQSTPFAVFTGTDSRGIYAFSDVNSSTTYSVTIFVRGYSSPIQTVTTGISEDNTATSGNVWGVDFLLTPLERVYVDDDAPGDPGPGNPAVSDPLETGSIEHPFDSIQEAIDLTTDFNEIEVAPGTYYEAITFNGKAIRLYSSGGQDITTIYGDCAYHVVHCVNGEGPDTILDGFTIQGGIADGDWPNSLGGGMFNNNSDPTVTNCIFKQNSAIEYGGGMFNHYSNPSVTNCTFSDNLSFYQGGGMHNYYSSPTVTNCIFSINMGMVGGGMYNEAGSNPIVTKCIFSNNIASSHAGGMYNYGRSMMTDCIFTSNSSLAGGGMFNGGGGSSSVTNCVFSGNSADYGAGMWNYDSSPTVTNCTFSNNTGGTGGGMYNEAGSNSMVTNCIFWGQTLNEIVNSGSDPIVTYSDVQGGYDGTGNIDTDPCFNDAISGDFRLETGSLCIDAGNNTSVPSSILKDLAGKLRYADDPCTSDTGNAGATGRPVVDLGAYEFQASSTTTQNLMTNPGFEVGDATGWITDWGFGLTADTNQVHEGNYSGLASDRTASWNGAWQSLLGLMDDGKTYKISGWLRLQNAASDNVILTVAQTDSTGTHYHGIDNATGYDDQWIHLEGTLALDVVGELTDLYIYFEGPLPGVNFYVDDAAVTEVMSDMNHNGQVDFIDFSLFASYYGFDCSTQDCGRANLNDYDNNINKLDLMVFCNNWLVAP